MHKTMIRATKVVLAAVVVIILFLTALPTALSYYDGHTRTALLGLAARELPPHASLREMTEFMRRHTARYSLDQTYQHEYTGIVAQTKVDKILFDRKVQVVLKVAEDKTYLYADVRVFYTAL